MSVSYERGNPVFQAMASIGAMISAWSNLNGRVSVCVCVCVRERERENE